MTRTPDRSYFSPEFFKFLRQLGRNNNREWILKNKPRYERLVQEPSLRYIKDVGKELKRVSPYLVADPRPFGGFLFRIYRDIRFSRDKSRRDCLMGHLEVHNAVSPRTTVENWRP